MELANWISLSPRFVLHKLNQKTKKNRNIKVLTAFITAFLLVGGFIAVTQSATSNHKICKCSSEKHCRCGNNCSCVSN
jgi:hypothetical protein